MGTLEYSYNVMDRQVWANFGAGGGGTWMICNCTVVMVGPDLYRRYLMRYDQAIMDLCAQLGVTFQLHHCGKFDEFVDVYGDLKGRLAMFDIGHESKVGQVMDAFPEAQVSYIISSQLMIDGKAEQVGAKVDELLDEILE